MTCAVCAGEYMASQYTCGMLTSVILMVAPRACGEYQVRLMHHECSVAAASFVVVDGVGSEGTCAPTETFDAVVFDEGKVRRVLPPIDEWGYRASSSSSSSSCSSQIDEQELIHGQDIDARNQVAEPTPV